MKVTKLTIKNIGIIGHEVIDLNKPLILFYGEIRQGKTTILNAVRWVCGGSFPTDIIKHGEKEASIELAFDGGCISRSFYKGKDGTTKAREVEFVRNGKPVQKPVSEIQKFLNPFLLDQDFLANKSETERKQFFTELFAMDTSKLDTELFNCERDARDLRSKIKGYGEIDLTPVDVVDASALKAQLADIRSAHETALAEWDKQDREARDHNGKRESLFTQMTAKKQEIADLESKLESAKTFLAKLEKLEKDNPEKPYPTKPTAPNTEELETKIQNSAAQNVRAEQFKANQKRAEAKAADETKLTELEKRGRDIKAEKVASLQKVSETCGVPGLVFDESGNFTYEGTEAGMLSTSQIMKLSSAISSLYPEGFGLDLIDRGESLGKSIFEFVERAKREEKTILATVVGERPATTPPEVGVFVVENGKIKA